MRTPCPLSGAPDGWILAVEQAESTHAGLVALTGKPNPSVQPGQSADFTFMAWVPRGERVGKIVLNHKTLGSSNTIIVPPTLPLP